MYIYVYVCTHTAQVHMYAQTNALAPARAHTHIDDQYTSKPEPKS